VVVEDGFVLVQKPTEDAQLSLSLPPPPSPTKAAMKLQLKCVNGGCPMLAAVRIPSIRSTVSIAALTGAPAFGLRSRCSLILRTLSRHLHYPKSIGTIPRFVRDACAGL